MSASLRKNVESLIFPKMNVLQTKSQKRVAEQEMETGQLRNTFSKETKTKEVEQFRISKVLATCVSKSRNSDVTARTNETVNQLKIINKKKRLQRKKISDVQSPGTSICSSINDTKIKFVTKISKRPSKTKDTGKISVGKFSLHSTEMGKSNTVRYNGMSFLESKIKISKTKGLVRPSKNNFSINAIGEYHFLHPVVNSKEKGNEVLYTISQVKCQEYGSKVFSIKKESDVGKEFLEVVDFGSEQENESSFREADNAVIQEDELIPD
ncbi:hypothetical protein AVEN_167898-1 [Araneus ventricosus]|uniref:Uncharacterized protein n=1 Tax=Araneus ventricosus TaxID=182803 RepID=A0A4Y2ISL3_ARAVE|nr:hypothetical protein AVEN_167898-1 [Araneus ventricosus]